MRCWLSLRDTKCIALTLMGNMLFMRKTGLLRILGIILCLLLPPMALASEPVLLTADQPRLNIYPHLTFYVDPSSQLNISQLLATPTSVSWTTSNNKTPNFGYSESTHWFKLAISNPTKHSIERLFEVGYPLLDHVSLYIVSAKGDITTIETGDMKPFSQRSFNHRNFVFPLLFPSNDITTLYLKVNTTTSVQVPLTLWQERFFMEENLEESMIQGAYFGIMLVMAIYNLFIFFTVRDKSYLFYVLYVLSFGFVQGSLNGFCFQYFWPDLIAWNDKTIAFFTPFSTASVLAFSLAFLGLKRTKSEYVLKSLFVAACFTCIAVFFVSYTIMIKVVIVLALTGMISVFITAILQLKDGNAAARYFILAWIALIVSIVSYGLNKLGILPRNFITENMLQIGSIIEIILLSFALADRVNLERRAKIEAQKLAMEISVIAKNERLVSEQIVHDSHKSEMAAHQESVEAKIESKAKSQFLATMSHEIRTPMNGVIGITELLQHTSLDSQQRGFLDIIKNSGQSLLTIINDILDYSKIVAGEMTLEKIDIDLEVMVNECSELFSLMAEEKQIKVGAIIEPGTPLKIHADPVRLRQIITNLMGNAIKFTETGYVLLKVKQISSSLKETCLRFEISDTGIGIDPSMQKHLFNEFKQADSSTTRKFGGTGLGLSICKRLVMLMNGDIGLESQLGNGACFWFNINFPVHEKPQRLRAIDNDHTLQGKNVLLISEDPLFRFLTDNVYDRWDITFSTITSFNALANRKEELKQTQFDAIFWDEKIFFDHRYAEMREIADEFDTEKTIFCLMTGLNCKWQANELTAVRMSTTMRYPTTAADIKNQLTDMFLNVDTSEKSTISSQHENFSTTQVLVAEDNPVNQIVIKGMLEKFSIYPDFADNGLEAVKKFTTNKYDIIFMDCEMPEMDGLEATLRIRQWEDKHKKTATPIVALTAHALKEHRDKAIHVGMDYFMVKPVSLDNVQHLLTEILNKHYSETA